MSKGLDKLNSVLQGIAQDLKKEGYRKTKYTWHWRSPDVVRVFNVQLEPDRFTFNLGVYFTQVESVLHRLPVTDTPKASECTVDTRIGNLMPSQRDKWWLYDEFSRETLPSELLDAWVTYGKPWIVRCSDLRDARKEFGDPLDTRCVRVAAMCVLYGDKAEARRVINHAIAAWPNDPEFQQRLRGWATTIGLSLSNP
jgi:hypothetical protein